MRPVIIESLGLSLEANPTADPAAIREGVRATRPTPANTFETVLGPLSHSTQFGDSSLKFISFYEIDPAAAGGAGGWVFTEQKHFGG